MMKVCFTYLQVWQDLSDPRTACVHLFCETYQYCRVCPSSCRSQDTTIDIASLSAAVDDLDEAAEQLRRRLAKQGESHTGTLPMFLGKILWNDFSPLQALFCNTAVAEVAL